MSKNIDEILQPRFKLIADYPGNAREIGSVSTEIATADYFRKFPANFKEMHWSEERELGDMPEYVKWVEYSPINKSKLLPERGLIEKCKAIAWGSHFHFEVNSHINSISAEYFIPATEEQYLQYLKSK